MQWTHPELDLTGTIADLGIAPRVGLPLLGAITNIQDAGLRAFLVSAILSSEPHRYAGHLGQEGTLFSGPGGRVLRAALLARACTLLVRDPRADCYEETLAGVMLGNLSPGASEVGARPDSPGTRRWLQAHARSHRSQLARWGCHPARIRQVISLSAAAATSIGEKAPKIGRSLHAEGRLAVACYANDGAIHGPARAAATMPLPSWMRPDLPWREAGKLLLRQIHRGMTADQWSARSPHASPAA